MVDLVKDPIDDVLEINIDGVLEVCDLNLQLCDIGVDLGTITCDGATNATW